MAAPTILTFREGSKDCAALGKGWSRPEPGFTWSEGPLSRLTLPAPDPPARFAYVELTLRAAFAAGNARRPLGVRLDGVEQPPETLFGETALGWQIERKHPRAPTIEVELTHPDTSSMRELGLGDDPRPLSVALFQARVDRARPPPQFTPDTRAALPLGTYAALPWQDELVRGVTGLAPAPLFTALESLGLNCEFGLAQRALGVETLGLLRFAGLDYWPLLRGLRSGFAGLGEGNDLAFSVADEAIDLCIQSRRYALTYHTFLPQNHPGREMLLARQPPIIAFRQRQLMALIASGEKLFVLYRPVGFSAAQALPAARILGRRGPGALLFITEAETGGSVTALSPRLFHGTLSATRDTGTPRYGPTTWLKQQAVTEWVSVAANAYRLWREHGGGAAA